MSYQAIGEFFAIILASGWAAPVALAARYTPSEVLLQFAAPAAIGAAIALGWLVAGRLKTGKWAR